MATNYAGLSVADSDELDALNAAGQPFDAEVGPDGKLKVNKRAPAIKLEEFDWTAARKAGYSDSDILTGLNSSGALPFNLDAARQAGYSDTDIADFYAKPVVAEKPQEQSAWRRAGDIGIDVAKGVVGLGESVVGLADLATAGYAGKGLEAIGYDPDRVKKGFESGYSTKRQASEKEYADATGILDSASALVTNPGMLIGRIAESAPALIGIMGAAGRAYTAAKAAGMTEAMAIAKASTIASAGEGAITAGQIAEQARQENPEDVAKMYYAIPAGAATAIISKVVGKLPGGSLETILAGKGGAAVAGNAAARVAKGVATEGLLEEGTQSLQEQFFTNLATNKPADEGLGKAWASGTVVGAAQGGAMALLNRRDPEAASTEKLADQVTQGTPVTDPIAPILAATPSPGKTAVDNAITEAFKGAGIRDLQDQAIALDSRTDVLNSETKNGDLTEQTATSAQVEPLTGTVPNSGTQNPNLGVSSADGQPANNSLGSGANAESVRPDAGNVAPIAATAVPANSSDIRAGSDTANDAQTPNTTPTGQVDGQQADTSRVPVADANTGPAAAVRAADQSANAARPSNANGAAVSSQERQAGAVQAQPTGEVSGPKNIEGRARANEGADGAGRVEALQAGLVSSATRESAPPSQRQPLPERRTRERSNYDAEVTTALNKARELAKIASSPDATQEQIAAASKAINDAEDMREASIQAAKKPEFVDYAEKKGKAKGEIKLFSNAGAALKYKAKNKIKGFVPRNTGEEWVLSKPFKERSAKQKANDAKLKKNTEPIDVLRDELQVALRKSGGIDIDEALANGFDQADIDRANIPGFGNRKLFRKGGMSLDAARESIAQGSEQAGYLDPNQADDLNHFIDRLLDSVKGNATYYSFAGQEYQQGLSEAAKEADRVKQLTQLSEEAKDEDGLYRLSEEEQNQVEAHLALADDAIMARAAHEQVMDELQEAEDRRRKEIEDEIEAFAQREADPDESQGTPPDEPGATEVVQRDEPESAGSRAEADTAEAGPGESGEVAEPANNPAEIAGPEPTPPTPAQSGVSNSANNPAEMAGTTDPLISTLTALNETMGQIRDSLTLQNQTPAELQAKKDAEEKAAKDKAAEEKKNEERLIADRESKEPFNLTGSDRSADVLEAGGQTPLFSREQSDIDKAASRMNRFMDEFEAGRMKSDDTQLLGNTPMVLQALGAPDFQMNINATVIEKVMEGKHAQTITADMLRQIPAQLFNPVAVFKSTSELDSLVVITELLDRRGQPIIVPVQLNTESGRYKVNNISSAYGKDNAQAKMEEWAKDRRLVYYNKEKTAAPSTTKTPLDWRNVVQLGTAVNDKILSSDDVVKMSRTKSKGGMTRAAVVSALSDAISKTTTKINVHETVADAQKILPTLPKDATAWFAPETGEVHLIAERMSDALMAEGQLFHELFHSGVSRTGFQGVYQAMNQVHLSNANIRTAAKQWLSRFGQEATQGYLARGMNENEAARQVRSLAIEEALAELSADNIEIKGINKVIAALQKALRAMGLNQLANWMEGKTNAEALQLIKAVREVVMDKRMTFTTELADKFSQVFASDPSTTNEPLTRRDVVQMESNASDIVSDDTKFSRPADNASNATKDAANAYTAQKLAKMAIGGKMIGELAKNPSKFNIINRTVNTQLHKALKNIQFGRVFWAAQQFQEDVSQFATQAADFSSGILPNLGNTKDAIALLKEFKNPAKLLQKKNDMKAAGRALFEGTMEGGGNPMAGRLYSKADLKAKGLTDRAIDFYQQSRKAIDKSMNDLVMSDVIRMIGTRIDLDPSKYEVFKVDSVGTRPVLIKAIDGARRDAVKVAGEAKQAHADAKKAHEYAKDLNENYAKRQEKYTKEGGIGRVESASKTEVERLGKEADKAEALMKKEAKRLDTWTDIQNKVEAAFKQADDLQAAGYAPLMRFGKYYVTATKGEETLHRAHYENRLDLNAAKAEMKKAFPDAEITTGIISDLDWKKFQGVSPETIMLFAKTLGLNLSEHQAAQQYYQEAVSSRSALKRRIKREGIPGFSDDLSRVLAGFITSNSRRASSNYNMPLIQQAHEQIDEKDGDIRDEATRLVDQINNPTEDAAALRGLMYAWFIGGSLASAAVNLTQPMTMTLPYLGQWGNTKAGLAIGKAMRTKLSPELTAALKLAHEKGITNPQEVYYLYNEAIRGVSSNKNFQTAMWAWGAMFSFAENINRRTTFLASHEMWERASPEERADMKAKTGAKNAFEFAERVIHETQGIYNKANRPNWARGAVGATVFTFKQYSIAYLELASRLPTKQKAVMAAILVLLAGLQGLPGADDLDDLIDTLGQMMGYRTNTKDAIHQYALDLLGETFGPIVTQGLSGASFSPMDLSGRLGMANLIPGTSAFKRSEINKGDDILEALGPVGSLGKGAIQSFDEFQAGDYGGGIAGLMPKAIGDLMKGAKIAATGTAKDYKNRTVVSGMDGIDATVQAMGFQPKKKADESRTSRAINQDVNQIKDVKNDAYQMIAEGRAENDEAKAKKGEAQIEDWNEKNPETPIIINWAAINQRVLQMGQDRNVRQLKAIPKEVRGAYADRLNQ